MKRFTSWCSFSVLVVAMSAHAAVDEMAAQSPAAATTTEAAVPQIPLQEQMVAQIDVKIAAFKDNLRKRTLTIHKLQQIPEQGPLYAWQSSDENAGPRRDLALRMASLSLKEGLKELDALENRRLEAQAELEWLKIQQEEIQPQATSTPDNAVTAKAFKCRVLPLVPALDQKPEVLQGFGRQKDNGTGLVWNSLGWWLSAIGSEVRACDSGRVVFVGEISGRGRVVMLDHGAGHLTVYANLDATSAKNLQRGGRVDAGTVLGHSVDRLYFEYRSKGVAADPREALRPELIQQITL
ncbi:MAG: M23 family metallopeptidase [Bdellovibrionota bacterium]